MQNEALNIENTTTEAAKHPKSSAAGLILVPTPLDFGVEPCFPIQHSLPHATLETASRIEHWLCENAKSLRAFLKRLDAVVPLTKPIQELTIRELPRALHKKGDHVGATGGFNLEPAVARELLVAAVGGHALGFASEAGLPCVADPGSGLVRAAHDQGIAVRALPGASSILQALVASGLNGQQFSFVGYLPTDVVQRAQRIHHLETTALKYGQTQLCIETPYRNQAVFDALIKHLKPQTRLCVAQGLLTPREQTQSRSVQRWRDQHATLPQLPTVFAWGA